MKQCNIVVQSKGGVGKSFAAWVLAQFGIDKGHEMYTADTDPGNPTFAGYKALNCLVSCDHAPRRSWPLFRAKAMLGELIAGFSSPGIHSQQEQLEA